MFTAILILTVGGLTVTLRHVLREQGRLERDHSHLADEYARQVARRIEAEEDGANLARENDLLRCQAREKDELIRQQNAELMVAALVLEKCTRPRE